MKKSQTKPVKKPRRLGRPSQQESKEIDEKIKAAALDMFLEHGYEAATMDAIAEAANITKRSLYARYKDKSSLFASALRKSREEWLFRGVDDEEFANKSFRDQLILLAELLLEQVTNPRIIKISRMAMIQAVKFSEEIRNSYDISLSPRIKSIVDVLESHTDQLKPAVAANPELSAELFISLITGIPARLASMGTLRQSEYEQSRLEFAVDLYLDAILNTQ